MLYLLRFINGKLKKKISPKNFWCLRNTLNKPYHYVKANELLESIFPWWSFGLSELILDLNLVLEPLRFGYETQVENVLAFANGESFSATHYMEKISNFWEKHCFHFHWDVCVVTEEKRLPAIIELLNQQKPTAVWIIFAYNDVLVVLLGLSGGLFCMVTYLQIISNWISMES